MEVSAVEALLLVDVQRAFVAGEHAVPDADRLLASIEILLARARQAGSLIIQLQNDGQPGTPDEPGQPGWELYLPPADDEPVIRKSDDDGFEGTRLAGVLAERGVERLAIAGLLSEMCVSATARAAMDRGLRVVLAHDAHASYEIPAASGFGPAVPASAVSRVAEWSLGDQVELVASASLVTFTAARSR